MPSVLSERIKAARKQKGWSQADLADALHIRPQSVYYYETGERDVKSSILLAIARALDVSPLFLLGIDYPPPPQFRSASAFCSRRIAHWMRAASALSMPWRKSNMMRSSWGCAQQVRRGVWRLRFWAKDSQGNYRRMSETVRGSRKDAHDRLAVLRIEHGKDEPVCSVGQFWEACIAPDMQRQVDAGTLANSSFVSYCSAWRAHVAPMWSSVPLDAVKPLKVQQWLYTLSYQQAIAAKKCLRKITKRAVAYELISADPMAVSYQLPARSTSTTKEKGTWTLDEIGKLWAASYGSPIEAAILLQGLGSARVGESLGVMAQDVAVRDVSGVPVALVNISRQVTRNYLSERLKTAHSARKLAIAGRAALRISELAKDGREWLSFAPDGGWLLGSDAARMFASVCRSARVPVYPMRNLRNSWATNSRWSLNIAPWLTEPMMGHVGLGVTGLHYDRPLPEMFAQAVAHAWISTRFDDSWDVPIERLGQFGTQ